MRGKEKESNYKRQSNASNEHLFPIPISTYSYLDYYDKNYYLRRKNAQLACPFFCIIMFFGEDSTGDFYVTTIFRESPKDETASKQTFPKTRACFFFSRWFNYKIIKE